MDLRLGRVDTHVGMHAHRGTKLLLAHCRALGRVEEVGVPASRRVELALGNELARLLTSALAPRGREQRRAA